MIKKRVKIPENIITELLYLCRNTCCICGTRGIALQIHHIDEDPSNNIIVNLIPLCLNCHALVHTKCTIGSLYNKKLLKKYRDGCINFYIEANEEAKRIFIKNKIGV